MNAEGSKGLLRVPGQCRGRGQCKARQGLERSRGPSAEGPATS